MISSLWNPTGGVIYHTRALRYRNRLWRCFRELLNEWLCQTPQTSSTLLWIGSSAGYNIESAYLERYDRIIVVETDPLARALLTQRFHQHRLEFIKQDLFEFAARTFAPKQFERCLEEHSQADVLFSNILGQVGFLIRDPLETEKRIEQIAERLRGRPWTTFHDRISIIHEGLPHHTRLSATSMLSSSDLAHSFFHNEVPIQVLDHGTHKLDTNNTTYLHWELLPHHHHVVGCAHHA